MCKRNIDWLPLIPPQVGAWPTTQACALSRNWTQGLLVCGTMPSPLSPISQGPFNSLTQYMYTSLSFRKNSNSILITANLLPSPYIYYLCINYYSFLYLKRHKQQQQQKSPYKLVDKIFKLVKLTYFTPRTFITEIYLILIHIHKVVNYQVVEQGNITKCSLILSILLFNKYSPVTYSVPSRVSAIKNVK